MTDHTPETTPEQQEPFIPPQYLLIIAGVAFLGAAVVAFTQPEFGVVGFGAIALGVLALLAWAFMSPQEARAALTGRTARFGGLSFLVTTVFIIAMMFVYIFVRNQNIRYDLTQRDDFSLSTASEEAIATLGSDPTVPEIRLLAFYGAQMSARRDQDAVLFDDYVQTSNGKISYEFVDPDRNPAMAEQYGVTMNGQIAVVAVREDGTLDTQNAELVNFFSQDELTNAILKVSAEGDFRAYIVAVEDGVSLTPSNAGRMSVLASTLTDQLDWTVDEVTFLELSRQGGEVTLNDPNVDGEVLVIVGGSKPLAEQELQVLTNYLDNGGQVVLFAGNSLNADQTSLATGEALSDYLFENFGLRFRNDIVIDQQQFIQNPLITFTGDLDRGNFITSNGLPSQSAVVFELAHSIEVAETPPENVLVTPIIRSSATAYAKSDLDAVMNQNIEQTEDDLTGPLVLAATAENMQTGARIALFGSTSLVQDDYALLQQGSVSNLSVAFNAFVWATNFNDFFQRTTIVSDIRPQDTPIFADAQTLRLINFVTIVLLPFGVLAAGAFVWWNGRERQRAA
ncbi:MAG: Gldg family protein [Chloroflexota bacterium]|nr:MAG: hypothetical protein DIU68_07345 [Chloroflexota bacterium]